MLFVTGLNARVVEVYCVENKRERHELPFQSSHYARFCSYRDPAHGTRSFRSSSEDAICSIKQELWNSTYFTNVTRLEIIAPRERLNMMQDALKLRISIASLIDRLIGCYSINGKSVKRRIPGEIVWFLIIFLRKLILKRCHSTFGTSSLWTVCPL